MHDTTSDYLRGVGSLPDHLLRRSLRGELSAVDQAAADASLDLLKADIRLRREAENLLRDVVIEPEAITDPDYCRRSRDARRLK